LRGLRFLDPACGSGNFLYVTLAVVKELELEVIREIERLGAREGVEQTEQILDEVHPRQFHGIEVSWWAREIAELTLWIGYHQFWRREHGGRTPPIPILEDTGTIECRDAILAWDEIVHRPEKDRPDPTPRIVHPVTGDLVPDPAAKLKYMEYVGARQAEWPAADFIVGNPPYIGNKRMRLALGEGYVDALRRAYPDVPEAADLVMYWWYRASTTVLGTTRRAGLITTNTITQIFHHSLIADAYNRGSRVVWVVRDHPWNDEGGGAAVRVTMTVQSRAVEGPVGWGHIQEDGSLLVHQVQHLNVDFSRHADVAGAAAIKLAANRGIANQGFSPQGSGFEIGADEAQRLLEAATRNAQVIRPFRTGRDVTSRPLNRFTVDFGLRTQADAATYTAPYQMVMDRVRPERASNRRKSYREKWWLYGEPRRALRDALLGIPRFLVTAYVGKHRPFVFQDVDVAPDDTLVCIAVDDTYALGVLSSRAHHQWALSAGGRLEDRPRYNKSRCFDPFPFPDPPADLRDEIGALAERLDQHRKDAIARDESVTMTGMYNVIEKLRSGEALTPKERKVHEIAACGVLRDLHDELDTLVAAAYGWPWPMEREEILERLVALHGERVEEEKRGHVRWLRPEYQIPRFAPDQEPAELDLPEEEEADSVPMLKEKLPWPKTAVEQLEAITGLATRGVTSVPGLVAGFDGADKKLVARHLETLVMLGEVGG
jgi:hypothetical protein